MLTKALKEYFGHEAFRENQIATIKSILADQNTIVILSTGGGKSLCYQLPAVVKEGMAIVVSPLIALMKSQVDFLQSKNIPAEYINSSLTKKKLTSIKKKVLSQELKLLYLAPETLNKKETIEFLQQVKISFIAIDEAHCISDWGHDFRPEYRKIRQTIEILGTPPVIALTATAPPQVQKDIIRNLNIDEANVFIYSFDRPNLYYEVQSKSNLHKKIILFIKKQADPTGIIYCQSRKKTEEIAKLLQNNHIKALPYHAGLDKKIRMKNQDDFFDKKIDIIVATIAFGMGIDKQGIRFVIHHDAPKSLENYYQETGRAGRDGKPAHCLLLYDEQDIIKLEKFNNNKTVFEKKTIQNLLKQVSFYARSGICRRKQILHYFGETYQASCQNCDNCQNPTATYEGKELLKKVLETIKATKEKFPPIYIIKVLNGIKDPHVLSNNHDKLPIFGKGQEQFHIWDSVIKQALLLGYLTKDHDQQNTLRITDQSAQFLKKKHAVKLYKEHNYLLEEEEAPAPPKKTTDATLLKKLRELREKQGEEKKIKPHLIFQETMLEAMAQNYPASTQALATIPGIGLSKANKFGKPFIELIAVYIEKHHIDPIESIAIRPNTSKFAGKIQIIQQIDRKIDLQRIASMRNITYQEFIKELENICVAGIRLNVTYAIDKILDEEEQEELYDYFYDADTDDVEEACNELTDDFSEEQVRLMHIKFLSEVVN